MVYNYIPRGIMDYSVSKALRNKRNLSERQFATQVGISRSILRKLEAGSTDIRLESLKLLSTELGRSLDILLSPTSIPDSNCSVVYLSMMIDRDGFDSWKIHLMDFVDNFRRDYDPRLIVLPPLKIVGDKIYALISSVVLNLCEEAGACAPGWARKNNCLANPWFVANMESL